MLFIWHLPDYTFASTCKYTCTYTHKHMYLVPGQILETGQEMNELDHSGFSTQTTTIYAGNIGGDRYILQVSDTSLRLLEGGKCFHSWRVRKNSALVMLQTSFIGRFCICFSFSTHNLISGIYFELHLLEYMTEISCTSICIVKREIIRCWNQDEVIFFPQIYIFLIQTSFIDSSLRYNSSLRYISLSKLLTLELCKTVQKTTDSAKWLVNEKSMCFYFCTWFFVQWDRSNISHWTQGHQ